jgi:hypothetical protein
MHATIHEMPAHAYELMIDTTSQQFFALFLQEKELRLGLAQLPQHSSWLEPVVAIELTSFVQLNQH